MLVRVLDAPRYPEVQRAWLDLVADEVELVAPTLLHYEVSNALHQQQRAGAVTVELAREGLRRALALPIALHGEPSLHIRASELAVEHRLPAAYDAHYLALAERFRAPLWTCDRRLHAAVGEALPWVRLVG